MAIASVTVMSVICNSRELQAIIVGASRARPSVGDDCGALIPLRTSRSRMASPMLPVLPPRRATEATARYRRYGTGGTVPV